jgi:N-acetyl-gamma-glutamyl-phosphate reductase
MSYLVKEQLSTQVSGQEIVALFTKYYENNKFVKIIENTDKYLDEGLLDAKACNNTNRIEISVYENTDYIVIISCMDNLGKGASGAAVQNMNIMLGLDENLGLKI